MIYWIISYFRALVIISALIGIWFVGYIEFYKLEYITNLYKFYTIETIGGIFITLYYLFYMQEIKLPYALNLHTLFSHNTFIDKRNRRSLFLDFFYKRKKVTPKNVIAQVDLQELNRFKLYYTNFTSINIDNYRQAAEKILHYFGLIEQGYEVRIYPKKSKTVELIFYNLPDMYDMKIHNFKKGYLFFGVYQKGYYYRDMKTLDHMLCVGESGSGKSNFMQLLLLNFLHNYNYINKMFLIDLKGGVELKRYENINNIEFVSDIKLLNKFLEQIIEELKSTQEYMLKHNIRKLNKYTMIIFDEIGAISTYPDKKLRESIFSKLALIAMQGRASGILLFTFAQKIDTTILPTNIVNNLQSRVLLKTSNDYNINIIDLKENIRERITATEIQDFKKGRAIIKDGLTSDKDLLQIAYINDSLLNMYTHLYSKKYPKPPKPEAL